MKKLKFWSRKKRKKKSNSYEPYTYYYPPPPAQNYYHHCCTIIPSLQPSAPPSLDYNDQTHHLEYASESQYTSSHEIVVETNSINQAILPGDSIGTCSYQQYMVPNPVYGLPLPAVQETTREKFSGFFGCVFNFGANFIHCFCPCFRIREVYQDNLVCK